MFLIYKSSPKPETGYNLNFLLLAYFPHPIQENIYKILKSGYYIFTAIISQLNNCSSDCLPLKHFVTARINPDSPCLKSLSGGSVHFPQHEVQTCCHLRPSMILILLTSSILSLNTSSCFSPLDILWILPNTPTISSFKSPVGILTFSETFYLGIHTLGLLNSLNFSLLEHLPRGTRVACSCLFYYTLEYVKARTGSVLLLLFRNLIQCLVQSRGWVNVPMKLHSL